VGENTNHTHHPARYECTTSASTQCSGSHFLKSYIESHFAGVVCSGEILREPGELARKYPALPTQPEFPHFWPWYEAQAAAGKISVAPDRRLEAFANYLSELSAAVDPGDLVIDAKYNSLVSQRLLRHGLRLTRFHFVYHQPEYSGVAFDSQNILKAIVSTKLALEIGAGHHSQQRSPGERLPSIRLNPKNVLFEIRYAFKLTQDYQNRFSGYANYDEVVYEDFVREQNYPEPGIYSRVLALFLDKTPAAAVQTPLPFKKTTPEDPSEVVENWQDVIRLVRTTEHGWMTDAPLLAAA